MPAELPEGSLIRRWIMNLVITVLSDETAPDAWGTIQINTLFSEARPALHFTPSFIETGVAMSDVITETLTLTNKGLADMRDVHVSLATPDGGAAPVWVVLNNAQAQGSLAVGEEKEIRVSFSPSESVAEGYYNFHLRVTSANHATRNINLYVSVTQSGVGNALFKVL